MSLITVHALDAATGTPASGLSVTLASEAGEQIADAVTGADGRIGDFGPEELTPGTYTVIFDTGGYFAARSVPTFYPRVQVWFTVAAGQPHYHIPLLLSPFAYSTYRGS